MKDHLAQRQSAQFNELNEAYQAAKQSDDPDDIRKLARCFRKLHPCFFGEEQKRIGSEIDQYIQSHS